MLCLDLLDGLSLLALIRLHLDVHQLGLHHLNQHYIIQSNPERKWKVSERREDVPRNE